MAALPSLAPILVGIGPDPGGDWPLIGVGVGPAGPLPGWWIQQRAVDRFAPAPTLLQSARSDAAEEGDAVEVLRPQLLVPDPETLLRGEAEHPDLALVDVAVHVERGLPGLGERVGA